MTPLLGMHGSDSIITPNTELPLYFNMTNPPPVSNHTHQPLCNILDLIVLVQETDMSLDD